MHDQADAEVVLVRIAEQHEKNRRRYSPAHDDEHTDGVMAVAAMVYLDPRINDLWRIWPFEDVPPPSVVTDDHEVILDALEARLPQLVHASALILAEHLRITRAIERLKAEGGE